MPRSTQAAGEAVPKNKILPFPSGAATTREELEATLTDLIADMARMSSVLSSLLEDRIPDTVKGALTVGRRDAADIQFVAGQVTAAADRVRAAWEALP